MEKISITKIITNTFIIPWNNLYFYSRVLSVPILVLVTVWATWFNLIPYSKIVSSLGFFIYIAAFAYLAITCHKLILTKNKPLRELVKINITQFSRFLLYAAIIYAIALLVRLIIVNIYVNAFSTNSEDWAALEIAEYIAYLPSMYIISRFCIIFPAIALGFKPKLIWAWKATRKNQFKILFLVALFPWAMEIIINLLYRDNSTLIERTFITLLTYISTIIAAFAISLTYYEIYKIEHKISNN